MQTKIVTREDILSWLKTLPEDRVFNMANSITHKRETCGCLLVQYMQDKGPQDAKSWSAGYVSGSAFSDPEPEYLFAHELARFEFPVIVGSIEDRYNTLNLQLTAKRLISLFEVLQ